MLWIPQLVQAQWNDHYDKRWFNLGFFIGLNIADVKLQYGQLEYLNPTDTDLVSVTADPSPGFSIGLITNLNLADHWDLRFVPSVSLMQRNFNFELANDSIFERTFESANLNIPLHVKFKSDFYRNTRVYVLAGPVLGINLVGGSDEENEDLTVIRTSKLDIGMDVALGIDLYGNRVKLAPEIRYSLGFSNVFISNNDPFERNISHMTTQSFTILLNFE